MSTRSWIGYINENGTVDYIYCHFDGYLEGVGKMLKECYMKRAKVEKLIALGNISSLGIDTESCNVYGEEPNEPFESLDSIKTRFKYSGDIEFLYIFDRKGKWTAYYVDVVAEKLK